MTITLDPKDLIFDSKLYLRLVCRERFARPLATERAPRGCVDAVLLIEGDQIIIAPHRVALHLHFVGVSQICRQCVKHLIWRL